MKARTAVTGVVFILVALAACGDDDNAPATDAGAAGESGEAGGGAGKAGARAAGSGGHAAGKGGAGGNGETDAESHTIGGQVSGLSGKGLALKNNGGNELKIEASGKFTFESKVDKDGKYEVTVSSQPSGQTCTVKDGTGTVHDDDISNVAVSCADLPPNTHKISGHATGVPSAGLTLKNNGGDELKLASDGAFTFSKPIKVGDAYAVSIDPQPTTHVCKLTHEGGKVGSGDVSDVTVACYANLTLEAVGRVGSVRLSWNNNGATKYDVYKSDAANCDFGSTCAGDKIENVTSPYLAVGLTNGVPYYFQVRGSHNDDVSTRSSTAGARPNRAVFDAAVNAIAVGSGDTVYVGGSFESVGPFTGPGVPVDKTTGQVSRVANYPIADGTISVAVPDGTNGFYLGGSFTHLGDAPRNYLAHILANGTVDPAWHPDPDGSVSTILVSGTTVYVGGYFGTIGSKSRTRLAAVGAADGVVTDWNPAPDGDRVVALAKDGDTLYVAGTFTKIGTVDRTHLAAFDVSTAGAGALKPDWHPVPGADVVALAAYGGVVYISGYFALIDGQTTGNLVAVDSGGVLKTDWQPAPDGTASALIASSRGLYVGGSFANVGGQPRSRLALLELATGNAVTTWNPKADDSVRTLTLASDVLYAGGDFAKVNDASHPFVVAIDTQGNPTSWKPAPNGAVDALAVSGDTVYVGGEISTFSPDARLHLAAFSKTTLTSWAPTVDDDVWALAVSGDNLYVGGSFKQAGASGTTATTARNGLARIDSGGQLTAWTINAEDNAKVYALALGTDVLYAGGAFTVGTHTNFAAIATANGVPNASWTSAPDGDVRAIAFDGTSVFVGGDFENVGTSSAKSHQHIAVFTAATGMLLPWNLDSSATVRALAIGDDYVYAGGDFVSAGALTRNHLARFTKGTGAIDAGWDPNVDGPVLSIVQAPAFPPAGPTLFVAGTFMNVAAASRQHLAQLATDGTGAATVWTASVEGDLNALAIGSGNLYLGGGFTSVGGDSSSRSRYTSLELPSGL